MSITYNFSELAIGLNAGTFSTPKEKFDWLLEEILKIDEPFNVRLINWIRQSSAFNEWCSCLISENSEIKLNDDKEMIKQFLYFAFKNNLGETFELNKDSLKRNIRNWLNQEDYSLSSSEQRQSVFQWAFALKQTLGETIVMFNKLFAQPAFIREPETLIFFYCLDKGLSYDDALDLIQRYESSEKPTEYIEDDVKNTNELYLSFIDADNKDDFLAALIQSSDQFEITNKRAKDRIYESIKFFNQYDFAWKIDDMRDVARQIIDGDSIDYERIELDNNDENNCFSENSFILSNLPLFLLAVVDINLNENNVLLRDFKATIKKLDVNETASYESFDRFIKENAEEIRSELIIREKKKSNNKIGKSDKEIESVINAYTEDELVKKAKMAGYDEKYDYMIQNLSFNAIAKKFCQAYGQEFEKHPFHKIPSSFLKKAFSRMPGYEFLESVDNSDSKNDKFEKYTKLRKMLILLEFFKYFSKKKNNTPFKKSIDNKLYECSFAPLYEPNAFDFVILFASYSDDPIRTLFDLWCYAAEEADKSKKK